MNKKVDSNKEINHCPVCHNKDITKYIYRKYPPWDNDKRAFNRFEIKETIKFHLTGLLNNHFLRQIGFINKLYKHLAAETLFSSLFFVYRCNDCGYGKYKREIMDEDLYNYYANLYHTLENRDDNDDINPTSDERAIGQFRFVFNETSIIDRENILNTTDSLSVLEIGAAEAYISRIILQEQNNCSIDVVEPMKAFDDYYKRHYINKVAEFFPFSTDKKYNYIHTSHWLEHMNDLESTLDILKSMLIRMGLIFVEVPNCTEDYWQENMRDDHGHIHYFTERSLISLFLSSGFELVKSITVGLSHPDLNKYWISPKLLNSAKLKWSSNSIRNNIANEKGSYIRALFRSPD